VKSESYQAGSFDGVFTVNEDITPLKVGMAGNAEASRI
jgi:hypothetical protein